jgi:hypothetical protein
MVKDTTSKIWGQHQYRIGSKIVPLNKILAWCNSCNTLEPVEDFSDGREVLHKIKKVEQNLDSHLSSAMSLLSDVFSFGSRRRHLEELRQLGALMHRIELIHTRTGDECCLTCGSKEIQPFIADLTFERDETTGLLTGQKYTGFVHPGCGGILIATPNYNDPIKQPLRQYASDGQFIEAIE